MDVFVNIWRESPTFSENPSKLTFEYPYEGPCVGSMMAFERFRTPSLSAVGHGSQGGFGGWELGLRACGLELRAEELGLKA